jgi:hypothetical protein
VIPLPPGVNTSRPELGGDLSGALMQVLRAGSDWTRYSVNVVDLDAGTTRVVYRAPRSLYLEPGRVNGPWMTFTACKLAAGACVVERLDTRNGTRVRAPAAPTTVDYASGVGPDGTTYFVRSRRGCGASVRLMRWLPGSPPETVVTLPARVDAHHVDATVIDGVTWLYFDRYDCGTGRADVYRLSLFDPPAAAQAASASTSRSPTVTTRSSASTHRASNDVPVSARSRVSARSIGQASR